MKLTDRLIEIMRSEFAKSKKWYRWSIFANIAMFGVSAILIICAEGLFATLLGICLFVIPVLIFVLREVSFGHQDCAEAVRRSLMMADAIDLRPSKIELAEFGLNESNIDKSEPMFDKRYYDSNLEVGPMRLVDILAESAFFTSALSARVAWVFGGLVIGGILVVFIVLYVLLNIQVALGVSSVVAKWAALVMAFLASGDFAYLCRRYFCLSLSAKEILNKSDAYIKSKTVSVEDAMKLSGEYNCAVIQAPPIPGIIYSAMLKALNAAWRKRQS